MMLRDSKPVNRMNEESSIPNNSSEPNKHSNVQCVKRNMAPKNIEVPCVFSQMNILYTDPNVCEWRETARWLKYEENVEEFCKRWSKPHVSSLSVKFVLELKRLLRPAYVCLDLEASSVTEIMDNIVKAWAVKHSNLNHKMTETLWDVLLARHKHVHLTRKDMLRKNIKPAETRSKNRWTFGEIKVIENVKKPSVGTGSIGCIPLSNSESSFDPNSADACYFRNRENTNMVRKIGKNVEICNILVGELAGLYEPLVAFVRLREAVQLADMCEIRRPTKFLYVLLCPSNLQEYKEIGRTMGSLMTSKRFRKTAYYCDTKDDLIAGVEEFLGESTLLPRETWDPTIRLVPPAQSLATKSHKTSGMVSEENQTEDNSHDDSNLKRTGRLFGGLTDDIKRKAGWYWSDFTDSAHLQCFATTIYIFLATLSPNVTFGGLLGQATDYNMASMECLLAAGITGVVFALFAGQPLNILGSTGPMLIMESILYSFCKDYGWDFMSIRVWIGLWTFLILMIIVAFDLSMLIRYVTRFTEETFACLIALIFIFEAHQKMFEINSNYPVNRQGSRSFSCVTTTVNQDEHRPLDGEEVNETNTNVSGDGAGQALFVTSQISASESQSYPHIEPAVLWKDPTREVLVTNSTTLLHLNGTEGNLVPTDCSNCVEEGSYVPDVLLLSVLLFLGTYIVARGIERFRTSGFFPQIVRRTISDFGVLISIFCMVAIDMFMGLDTPKLIVPSEFKPTRPDRGWVINPFSEKNPKWLPLAGCIPAILSALLIFMDQQITAVIVNRKENKLKKGGGYHLDLAVVAILIAVCSILGLPWYVAATVSAIVHIMALRKESECVAPGEPISFNGVREQRMTALLVGILNGVSVLFTSVLQLIPMPVLYGVFLYMGITSLSGMQLIDRTLIMFQPIKHQPDYPYLRHVAVNRVHMYTVIQIICLIVLWLVKSIKSISILFPLMVVAICFIRKLLDLIYTDREMYWLDSILPSMKETSDAERKSDVNNPAFVGSNSDLTRKLSNQQANLVREFNGKSALENTLNPKFFLEEHSHQSVSLKKTNNGDERKSPAVYVSKL